MSTTHSRDWRLLEKPAAEVAPLLLGCRLVREYDGRRLVARIVETEAYDQSDAASHSYRGRTPRTEVMFGPPGHLYVYFTYGMHYCMNIVTGREGHGSAVLIRAVEPMEGEAVMIQNRHGRSGSELTNGPAKVCQALAINRQWNDHDLRQLPLQLQLQPPLPTDEIVQSTRIGISKAKDTLWRFYVKSNPYVSKPKI